MVIHAKIDGALIEREDLVTLIAYVRDGDRDLVAIGERSAVKNRFFRSASGTPNAAKLEYMKSTVARHSRYNIALQSQSRRQKTMRVCALSLWARS